MLAPLRVSSRWSHPPRLRPAHGILQTAKLRRRRRIRCGCHPDDCHPSSAELVRYSAQNITRHCVLHLTSLVALFAAFSGALDPSIAHGADGFANKRSLKDV
jgi:hypothetical protein